MKEDLERVSEEWFDEERVVPDLNMTASKVRGEEKKGEKRG